MTTARTRRLSASARRWLGAALGGRPLVGPALVQLGISDICDGNCTFCRYWAGHAWKPPSKRLMPLAEAEDLLTQLARAGVREVELCGRGEPLLNPDCVAIAEAATRLGMLPALVTNGLHLAEHNLGRLLRAGLRYVNVSLDAGRPDSYAAVHRGGSSHDWDRAVDGLRAVVAARTESGAEQTQVTVSLAVCRPTCADATDLAALAIEVGATGLLLFPAALSAGMEDLEMGDDDRARAIASAQEAARVAERAGISHNVSRVLQIMAQPDPHRPSGALMSRIPCYAGYFFAQIGAGGEVYPCCACDEPVGSVGVGESSFVQVLQSEAHARFRQAARAPGRTGMPGWRCHCEGCFYAWTNLDIHRRLRPWTKAAALRERSEE